MTTTDTTTEKAREQLTDALADIIRPIHWETWKAALFSDKAEWPDDDEQEAITRCVDDIAVLEHWDAWGREIVDKVADYLAALTASPEQGEWISVPREPTEAMCKAAFESTWLGELPSDVDADSIADIWSAMLTAAPVAPSSGEWIESDETLAAGLEALAGRATQSEWQTCLRQVASSIRSALELPSTPKPAEKL